MESDIEVQPVLEAKAQELWRTIEEHRDTAVSNASVAAKAAIELGQLLAQCRDGWGIPKWQAWVEATLPAVTIAKATRLATVGMKYRNFDADQLELKVVKELYQAADILPPSEPTNTRTDVINTNWQKLVAKIEAMVSDLNPGQRAQLKATLIKLAEGL